MNVTDTIRELISIRFLIKAAGLLLVKIDTKVARAATQRKAIDLMTISYAVDKIRFD